LRILVAEDESNILLMYKIFLEGEGHDVITSRDGIECVEQYELWNQKNLPFDVVMMDYRMPKMDGRDAAKRILAIHPGQTIVMITAYSKELEGLFSGIEEIQVLQKPFELDSLLELLKSVYERKRSQPTSSLT
jgi:two-component system chemotaxis response regulator CheY